MIEEGRFRTLCRAAVLLGASALACAKVPPEQGAGAGCDTGTGDVGGASGGGDAGDLGLADAPPAPWRGINLSSAEWGALPGRCGTDYTYPTRAEIDAYTALGMRIFRLPFAWERMQPALRGDLDPGQLAHLDGLVGYATARGARVIVDPHNYARYGGQVIGGGAVGGDDLADLWSRLAAHYAANPLVVFGLMNEPHNIDVHVWLDAANRAIAAIRAAGAANLILVPGTNWTGAHSWTTGTDVNDNQVMIGTVDSGDNYAFEVHQYLDSDFSGSHPACQCTTIGTSTLQGFEGWLRANGRRGFLGELGGGPDATCLAALDGMLTEIEAAPDLWLGWTYWAGGPWWRPPASMTIPDGTNPPQLMLMATHLQQP